MDTSHWMRDGMRLIEHMPARFWAPIMLGVFVAGLAMLRLHGSRA